jgi:hypothetical protein
LQRSSSSFKNISIEVLSLHVVPKELEETLSEQPLLASKQEDLITVTSGYQSVLQDLQALVEKYESFGSQSKWTWGRLKRGLNDIAELRARLISPTVLLTSFIRSVIRPGDSTAG